VIRHGIGRLKKSITGKRRKNEIAVG
jgi:hypothetical protein